MRGASSWLGMVVSFGLQVTAMRATHRPRRVEEMLPAGRPRARRAAGERGEFADEMGLVGIAAGGGEVGPAVAGAGRGHRLGAVEAGDAGDRLRGEADLLAEARGEVLAAPFDVAGEVGDPDGAAGRDDPARRRGRPPGSPRPRREAAAGAPPRPARTDAASSARRRAARRGRRSPGRRGRRAAPSARSVRASAGRRSGRRRAA